MSDSDAEMLVIHFAHLRRFFEAVGVKPRVSCPSCGSPVGFGTISPEHDAEPYLWNTRGELRAMAVHSHLAGTLTEYCINCGFQVNYSRVPLIKWFLSQNG